MHVINLRRYLVLVDKSFDNTEMQPLRIEAFMYRQWGEKTNSTFGENYFLYINL